MDNSFEREVLDRLIKIEAKLESWDNSKKQIYDNKNDIIHLKEQNEQQQKDIDALIERNRWLGRAIAGAVITAVVTVIFALVKLG